MKNLLKYGVLALLTLQVPSALAQDAVATVSQVIGDDGTVVVIRESDAFALREGDRLFDGDRVIVRAETSVVIDGVDCTVSLEASQTLMVSSNLCDEAAALATPEGGTFAATSTEAVGAAAPLWTLFAATGAPAIATADALTDGGTPQESDPIVAENTGEAVSP